MSGQIDKPWNRSKDPCFGDDFFRLHNIQNLSLPDGPADLFPFVFEHLSRFSHQTVGRVPTPYTSKSTIPSNSRPVFDLLSHLLQIAKLVLTCTPHGLHERLN